MAPGGIGVDWRVHARLDLAAQRLIGLEVTGPGGGETFDRHSFSAGEVVLADRGYAHREATAGVIEGGAHVLVRGNWQNFPLESRSGAPVDIVASLETLAAGEIGDWAMQFRANGKVYPVRLVAVKKTHAATVREQKRIRYQAQRKRRRPDPRSLRAAHYVYVITDLPADVLPAPEALELYRLRWQIEIAFKRLKSILKLDRLRAHEPRLAKTYLYGKLLTALILDELCASAVAFFPWGFPIFHDTTLSLALADTAD
jgi:IS4 transposase